MVLDFVYGLRNMIKKDGQLLLTSGKQLFLPNICIEILFSVWMLIHNITNPIHAVAQESSAVMMNVGDRS